MKACILCLILKSNLPSFGTLWQHFRQVSSNHGLIFWRDIVELKYPLTRPYKPGTCMLLTHTKKVLLSINHTQIWPSEHDILPILSQWLDITRYQDSRHSFWLANCDFGYSKCWLYGLTILVFFCFVHLQPPRKIKILADEPLREYTCTCNFVCDVYFPSESLISSEGNI